MYCSPEDNLDSFYTVLQTVKTMMKTMLVALNSRLNHKQGYCYVKFIKCKYLNLSFKYENSSDGTE